MTEKDTLKIILAEKGIISEARARYYDIIDNYQINQYHSEITTLQKALEEQTISAAEYGRRAQEAEEALHEAGMLLDEYADMFARINKDDMDSISNLALNKLDAGDVDGAISVYEACHLLEQLKDKINIRNASVESIENLIPQLKKEVSLRRLIAGKSNIEKADAILEQIALNDTTNYDNMYQYFLFLIDRQEYDRALKYGDIMLANASELKDIAAVQQQMGHIFYKQSNFEKAKQYLQQSLDNVQQIALNDSVLFIREVSYPLNTLANVYFDTDELEKAEQLFLQVVEIRNELLQTDSSFLADYATAMINLGDLYRYMNELEKAVEYTQEALNIRTELAKKDANGLSYSLANANNNMGTIYLRMKKYDEAMHYYMVADSILEQGMQTNPDQHKTLYVISLNNIGMLYRRMENWESAEKYYLKAAAICRQYEKLNPETYTYYLGIILNNLGAFYRNQNKLDEAERYNLEALEKRKTLLQYSDKYEVDVAMSYQNLGRVYASLNKTEEAKNCYTKAYSTYKVLANNKPETYQQDFARISFTVGDFYKSCEQLKQAKKYYKESYKAYKQLEKRYPNKYLDKIKEVKEALKKI